MKTEHNEQQQRHQSCLKNVIKSRSRP